MSEQAPNAPPLQSITVIDLGQIYNGSYATFLMAMAGARVIKSSRRVASILGAARVLAGRHCRLRCSIPTNSPPRWT